MFIGEERVPFDTHVPFIPIPSSDVFPAKIQNGAIFVGPADKKWQREPETGIQMRFEEMEHNFRLEHSVRENGTTFSEVPFFPEILRWNEPKKCVLFTTQPKFPESLGKWKTPKISVNENRIEVGYEWIRSDFLSKDVQFS